MSWELDILGEWKTLGYHLTECEDYLELWRGERLVARFTVATTKRNILNAVETDLTVNQG